MTTVHGTCISELALVREVFEEALELKQDLGASVAVTIGGELVADLWGGTTTDPQVPWQADTIANVYSTSKTMTALAILRLTDDGVGLDDPVARFWPEFGQVGKGNVTIAQVLSHSSGVAGWDDPIELEDLYNPPELARRLETQLPWWLPGQSAGYHAFTHGVILGEVIRRVTGKTIGTFFRDELAEPRGADFFIGLPESEDARVTGLTRRKPEPSSTWSPPFAVATRGNPVLTGSEPRLSAWRRAEIPSVNGHGNARSVALIQSILACRGVYDGRRYFGADVAERVLEPQISGVDLVLGSPLVWGMGYALPSFDNPLSPSAKAGYWGGAGGSFVLVDLDREMTMSYVMNKMGDAYPGHDPRVRRLIVALYSGLVGLQRSAR